MFMTPLQPPSWRSGQRFTRLFMRRRRMQTFHTQTCMYINDNVAAASSDGNDRRPGERCSMAESESKGREGITGKHMARKHGLMMNSMMPTTTTMLMLRTITTVAIIIIIKNNVFLKPEMTRATTAPRQSPIPAHSLRGPEPSACQGCLPDNPHRRLIAAVAR